MPDIFNRDSLKHTVKKEKVVKKHRLAKSKQGPIHSAPQLQSATDPLDVSSAEVVNTSQTIKATKRHVDEYSSVMRQERPVKTKFHAYAPKPPDATFVSQVPKEQIILILRQHPITQLKNVLIVISMILGFVFINLVGFFDFFPASYRTGITLFWFLVVIGYSFAAFLKWLYNMYIITDERIIDIDVFSFLKRNLTSAKIDNIEDVTAANYGLLGSIFDVGIVVVQTAGATPMLEFGGVPHPARVVTLINELILEEEREKIEGRVM